MTPADFTIGRLARETGCTVQTIRYYEQIGLMPPPVRSAGNQRRYGPAHAARLGFIRHSRDLGFPLEAVRELLAMADDPDRPCAEADSIARRQLADVDRRIAQLTALRAELQRLIAQCHGGRIADCRIIEALSEPGAGVAAEPVPADQVVR
jgi:Cu(I)-responsive transcriptional regulator